LLGAQASRLPNFNQESFKLLPEPYCLAFEYMQAGRLRSQQPEVFDKPEKLNDHNAPNTCASSGNRLSALNLL
jgi:hypothetical protein